MFWGYFSWRRKGPCYIWKVKIKKERKTAKEEINVWNFYEEAYPDESFVFNAVYGKRQRRAKKKKIDWYKYGIIIFEKKFLFFVFKY